MIDPPKRQKGHPDRLTGCEAALKPSSQERMGIVSRKAGHPERRAPGPSRVGVTLDLYSHVLPGMQEDAAYRVDEAFRLAIEKRASKDVR